VDEVNVSKIDDGVQKIRRDEDRVHLPNRIGEEDQPSSQAEIPESHWDDALSPFLRGNPLNDKPHGKHRLPNETEEHPEVQLKSRVPYRKSLKKTGHEIKD
jgi:hypothetical protein